MTYVLIHGAGDSAASWELVSDELRDRGHDVVAVDLPIDDESAGWAAHTDAIVEAVGNRTDLIVVAHSLGGFAAPLVCARLEVDLLVLVAAMVPLPGETVDEWWGATGYARAIREHDEVDEHDDSAFAVFFHDVAPEVAVEAMANERRQVDRTMHEPWPLEAWPDVPTRHVVCRDDRMFPAAWLSRVVERRLGIVSAQLDGGHCPHLSRPAALVDLLELYRVGLSVSAASR